MKELIIVLVIAIFGFTACNKFEDVECYKKFGEPTHSAISILAGESDSTQVFREVKDSSAGANSKENIYLDTSECTFASLIQIYTDFHSGDSDLNKGGNIMIKSNNPNLSFCTAIYNDSIFKKEYVQTWETKRDSVTFYSSYNQDGAGLYGVNSVKYAKRFTVGEEISAKGTFETGPIELCRKWQKSYLSEPVFVDFQAVFTKVIYDIKSTHIDYEEDYYLGFKYETESYLQLGYIHLVIDEQDSEDFGNSRFIFYLRDWGISI